MKNLLLGVAISSLFMISCNNELDSNLSNVESKALTKTFVDGPGFQIVNHNGDDCLQFSNDSIYNETITKLAEMSNEEIDAFFSGLNFVSQQKLMEEADKEQEAIVDAYEKDPNQPWPYQQIAEFKQKYDDVFMFNPYDSTDFVANCKVKNTTYRDLANKQGVFLIGDSVVKCQRYTLEEFFGSPIATYKGDNITTDRNSINRCESKYQIPNGDYVKVRAIWNFEEKKLSHGNYQYIDIDFLSQKKKVLWKKHHARVILQIKATGSGNGLEIYDKGHQKFDNQNDRTFTMGIDTYDKLNVNVGRFGETPIPSGPVVGPFIRYSLKGTMEIWSNEIPEARQGLGTLLWEKNW